MKKRLTALLLVFVLLTALCTVSAFAEDKNFIFDDSGLLSDAAALEAKATGIYQETGIAFCFWSSDSFGGSQTLLDTGRLAAQDLGYENTVLLVVDANGGQYNIFTTGKAEVINDNGGYYNVCSAYEDAATWQGGVEAVITECSKYIPELEGVDISGIVPVDRNMTDTNLNVIDYCDILGPAAADLNRHADNVSDEYRFDVVVLFADTLEGKSAQAFTDDFYDYNGFGYGESHDGIILMVCPTTRDYHIAGTGNGIPMFDAKRLSTLESDVVARLRNDEWAEAADAFISDCEYFLSQGMPQEEHAKLGFGDLLASLAIGFGAAFVPGAGMKSQMKSVAAKNEARHYVKENGINITNSFDQFVTMTVTRRRIQRENSGGTNVHRGSSGTSHSGRGGKF